MNKRLWLIISAGIFIILLVFILLSIKKGNLVLPRKGSEAKEKNTFSISSLLSQAKELEIKADLWEAKGLYQKLISEFPNAADIMSWQKKIEEINMKLLFSNRQTPGSILYEIRPGDTLTKIAKEFKTTAELIKKSNQLSDDKILPGRKIKVWTKPFGVVVDKSQNTLILKTDEEIIKTYVVSTGLINSTPVGKFKIMNKLTHPTWFKAGVVVPAGSPENILGSAWLGFDLPGYGIHGTNDPESLGRQVTQGCVRMSNPDIEELYTILPIGTEVAIVD